MCQFHTRNTNSTKKSTPTTTTTEQDWQTIPREQARRALHRHLILLSVFRLLRAVRRICRTSNLHVFPTRAYSHKCGASSALVHYSNFSPYKRPIETSITTTPAAAQPAAGHTDRTQQRSPTPTCTNMPTKGKGKRIFFF